MKKLYFFDGIAWKNFLFLTLAGCINAIGVTMFISPVNLYDSGISGTSIYLSQMSGLPLSAFLILLNVPLFLFGLKKQGKAFTIYSIYTVIIYSFCAWLITDILPVDVNFASPLAGQDLLLCALFGGMISGVGSGITIRYGGSIDGIEIMAIIFAKKLGTTVGTFVMCYNVVLYIICGLTTVGDWILPLYSIVTYMAGMKTVDFIVEGLDRSKAVMIMTEKPQEVSQALIEEFETGTTLLNGRGGYSNREKTVVYFVVNRFQIARMRNLVHALDPKAFMTITDVADVFKANDDK